MSNGRAWKRSVPASSFKVLWALFQPVERLANGSWLNGWVVIDERNPDAIAISGHGSQKDTVPSYLLRACQAEDPSQLDLDSLPF